MTGQRLSALLAKINIIEQHGPADPLITSLAYDSREVEGGGLFFALRGIHSDGHDFIPAVVEKGASAVVCMDLPDRLDPSVTYLRVENSRTVMSPIADAFYGDPSSDLTVIGITGTDGKSTTAYFIQQLLQMSGRKCGLLTTVQFDLGEGPRKNHLRQSTPEATDVHRLLRQMRDNGCTHAVVEATSHGLSKVNNRLGDVKFNVGVLTNISHEHLEFHKTMERYIDDKANLFRALPADSGWAILNMDDGHRDAFLSAADCAVLGYGVDNPLADLRAENIVESAGQQIFDVVHTEEKTQVLLPQPGRFNIENCLAALLAASSASGETLTPFLPFVQKLKAIRGRMVPVDEGQPFEVLVDYAHTPGSFEKLFPQLRDRVEGKLIAVFGSAGERDREKRPILGSIAAAYCDRIVLADEDPRGEVPSSILKEIAAGCDGFDIGKDLFLIEDRPAAIAHAFSLAGRGDLVVLLGKGHEGSIIYADRTLEWDEEQQARKILRTMKPIKRESMSKKQIGILFGGKSGEHEVSLISAASVYTHIDTDLFIPILIGIDYDGRWYLQDPPRMDSERHSLVLQTDEGKRVSVCPGEGLSVEGNPIPLDAVFPVLHGTFGEDGTIQGLLELADIPYIGAGVLGSSLGMDKAVVKKVWIHDGLVTVPFVQADSQVFHTESGPKLIETEAEALFDYPLFVKPARSGSSVGVGRAENREQLKEAMEEAFRFDTKLLIEPEMKGREVECSVMGNEEVKAYGVGEIVPTHGFYDYETKYLDPDAAELRVPAPISRELTHRVREIAKAAYRSAEAEGFARVDFFIQLDNTVVLNEINTIPGFTHISMFPKLCEYEGLEYGKLITSLIDLALDRYERRTSLQYRRI